MPQTMSDILEEKRKKKLATKAGKDPLDSTDDAEETSETSEGNSDKTVGAIKAANSGVKDMQAKGSGNTTADVGGGMLSGAATGATIGSAFGPGYGTAVGAGVGAVVGGLTGFMKAQQAKKEKEREARILAAKLEGEGRLQAAATMSEMINNIRRTMGV